MPLDKTCKNIQQVREADLEKIYNLNIAMKIYQSSYMPYSISEAQPEKE